MYFLVPSICCTIDDYSFTNNQPWKLFRLGNVIIILNLIKDFYFFFVFVSYQKSVLSNLIQEIEPLDVSLIQKDVPPTTIDAMKRTISGMLGLLPSDQFQVLIEALWEPISKLLISSMMTGYALSFSMSTSCPQPHHICS